MIVAAFYLQVDKTTVSQLRVIHNLINADLVWCVVSLAIHRLEQLVLDHCRRALYSTVSLPPRLSHHPVREYAAASDFPAVRWRYFFFDMAWWSSDESFSVLSLSSTSSSSSLWYAPHVICRFLLCDVLRGLPSESGGVGSGPIRHDLCSLRCLFIWAKVLLPSSSSLSSDVTPSSSSSAFNWTARRCLISGGVCPARHSSAAS